MRLISDVVSFTYKEVPKWNPINVCSYHLQEAGATPEQELAFALANAIAVLDAVKASGQVPPDEFPQVVGRISFFCNAGIKFITELCKMRAFNGLWDEICAQRYRVEDPKLRRFRYGVQVNSLGLTEQQPENNVYRILLEMLAVVMSKDARARAVQLPAWNEALGLPRPWDQQWSLRLQQIVAYETDLLDFEDIFDGSRAIAEKVEQLMYEAREELAKIGEMGGAVAAIETSYMKRRLVESNAMRLAAIEAGEQIVVGVNKFVEAEPSPLASGEESIITVDPRAEQEQIAALQAWRANRDEAKAKAALADLVAAAKEGRNIMEPSIACAHAGVTTGEWSGTLREIFGEFRAPTGVSQAVVAADLGGLKVVRTRLETLTDTLGRRIKMLVGKPGLDGHSNGAEQIALRARDAGFEVVYEGIRLTPEQIVSAALEEGVHVVGLSILSGSHVPLVTEIMERMKAADLSDVPVVVGGIIPPEDAAKLAKVGVARVYTPKDFDLNAIMADILTVVEETAKEAA
jgi:(2R)-ethylmalonyl-CoA mutase